jgi:hypothetical protein
MVGAATRNAREPKTVFVLGTAGKYLESRVCLKYLMNTHILCVAVALCTSQCSHIWIVDIHSIKIMSSICQHFPISPLVVNLFAI